MKNFIEVTQMNGGRASFNINQVVSINEYNGFCEIITTATESGRPFKTLEKYSDLLEKIRRAQP